VSRDRLADCRGRWLAFGATLAVSAAMLYAQHAEPPRFVKKPEATAPSTRPTPSPEPAPLAAPPHIASPAEAQSLAADAPAAAQSFQFSLPAGVAPENGLQVKTIWAARAISLLFPQITAIGGYRQDPLKWHPNGLAIDVMIPNPDSPEGIELGNQIAGFALANSKRWGIDDVIWRHAIYLGADKGEWMSEMGSETANHFDHVHIATDGGGYPTGNEKYYI